MKLLKGLVAGTFLVYSSVNVGGEYFESRDSSDSEKPIKYPLSFPVRESNRPPMALTREENIVQQSICEKNGESQKRRNNGRRSSEPTDPYGLMYNKLNLSNRLK